MKRLIVSALTVIVLASCGKEKLGEVQSNKVSENASNELLFECNELSDENISQIGVLHNRYLDATFKNFNFQNKNVRQELEDNFNNIDLSPYFGGNNTDLLKSINEELLASYLENPKVKFYFDAIDNILDDSENYQQIEFAINNLYQEAKNELECNDQNVVLTYLETIKYSSYFWLPSSIGGSGTGNLVIAKFAGNEKISPFAKRIIVADGLAAAATLTGYGLLAGVTGPVGWGALVAMVGFNAAWGSGLAAAGIG